MNEDGPKLTDRLTAEYQEPKDMSLCRYGTEKVREFKEWRKDKRSWADYPHARKNDSSAERHLYYRIARDLGPGNYADIGVWRGGSSAALANGLFDGGHRGTIYAVDFFGGLKGKDNGRGNGRDFGETPEKIVNYVKGKGLDSLVDLKICQGNSIEIGKQYQHVQFNFVSIDGDHTYLGCKTDYKVWGHLVKQDGLLAFNDICCLSVDRVIRELNPTKWKFVQHIYNTKVFKRL